MEANTVAPELFHKKPDAIDAKGSTTRTNTLTPELLHKMDAYWRAANYLSVGQIYLYDKTVCRGLLGFGMPS